MAQVTLNQNQFIESQILGQVSMIQNPNVIPVRLNPSSTAVVQAGSVVKLIASTSKGPEIVVDATTGPLDGPVFGVVLYNPRKNIYAAGDVMEVGADDTYVYLEASAVILRGAKVTCTAATVGNDPTVATVTVPATQYVVGIAMDPATAANQLIRVKITPSLNAGV